LRPTGSQISMVSPGPIPRSPLRMRAAVSVVSWLCITPLGPPVVPEVNAIRITVSASWRAATNPSGEPCAATVSSRPTMPGRGAPRMTPIRARSGSRGRNSSAMPRWSKSRNRAQQTNIFAPEKRRKYSSSRRRKSTLIGTATAARRSRAKKTNGNSTQFGSWMATTSLSPMPRVRNLPAMRSIPSASSR